MPVSHICPLCGEELGRMYAGPDPVYGLSIAICRGCGEGWVRRRHPLVAAWRRWRSALAASAIVVAQMLFIGGCSVVVAWTIVFAEESLANARLGLLDLLSRHARGARGLSTLDWVRGEGEVVSVVAASISAGLGAWLAATVRHVPVFLRLAGWCGILLLFESLMGTRSLHMNMGTWIQTGVLRFEGPSAHQCAGLAVGAALCTIFAAAGTPIGYALSFLAPVIRTRLFARRRTRMRRARRSQ